MVIVLPTIPVYGDVALRKTPENCQRVGYWITEKFVVVGVRGLAAQLDRSIREKAKVNARGKKQRLRPSISKPTSSSQSASLDIVGE